MNLGMTEAQLQELMNTIEKFIGKTEADSARQVLKKVVESKK
jgi:hypothetical protein